MTNSRQKGKRIERDIVHLLKDLFPLVSRNANEQSQMGGVDLKGTQPFAIEVKGGKMADIVKIRQWLDQASSQITKEYPLPIVIARPNRKKMYAVVDIDVIMELLACYKRYNPTTDSEKTS